MYEGRRGREERGGKGRRVNDLQLIRDCVYHVKKPRVLDAVSTNLPYPLPPP